MNPPIVKFPVLYPDAILTGKREDGRPLYMLQVPFVAEINGKEFTIPAGFVFDFASIPRIFWSFFLPDDPQYAAAALLHDWAYSGEWWPRDFNDRLFLAAMKFTRVPVWKRGCMYSAVRVGGGFTYKEHSRGSVMRVRGLSGVVGDSRPLWR